MEKMTTTRALRNAILSVVETINSFDCTDSALETLEVLHKLLFAAEQKEADDNG